MKVAVVILNWNGQVFLEQFLPSVTGNSAGAEIIVADNASTDDSVSFLTREFPQVRRIVLPENLGFAGGYNAALKQVQADYFILLNSDVEVTPGWIAPLVELLEKKPMAAAVQPKMRSYNNKSEFEYAGAAGGYLDKFGYPFCRGRIFDTVESDKGQYDDSRKIFWASGACFVVRSQAFYNAGGFDESFFAHMEEIDLCWRLQKAGHEIWYCPQSTVYHVGGGTLSKSNPFKTYLNFRNNLLMLGKNLDENQFRKVYRAKRILDFIAALKFLAGSGGYREMAAVFKAHRDFRRQRSTLRIASSVTETEMKIRDVVYQESILFAYFVRGKKLFSKLAF